eukprot:gene6534-10541_t
MGYTKVLVEVLNGNDRTKPSTWSSVEDFWYLSEQDQEQLFEEISLRTNTKSAIKKLIRLWNPLEQFSQDADQIRQAPTSRPSLGSGTPQGQQIKTVEPRKKFETRFPTYKNNIWNFLQELNTFVIKENVTKKETELVIRMSIPENILEEFKTKQADSMDTKWDASVHRNSGKEIDSVEKIQEIIESLTTDITKTKERRRCIKCQIFMEENSPKHLARCDKCHAKIKKEEQEQRERAGKQEEKGKSKEETLVCFHCGKQGHSKPKRKDASKAQTPAGKKSQESFQARFSNFRQMLSQMDTAPDGEDSDFNFIKSLMFRMATTQDTVMDIINQHSRKE